MDEIGLIFVNQVHEWFRNILIKDPGAEKFIKHYQKEEQLVLMISLTKIFLIPQIGTEDYCWLPTLLASSFGDADLEFLKKHAAISENNSSHTQLLTLGGLKTFKNNYKIYHSKIPAQVQHLIDTYTENCLILLLGDQHLDYVDVVE